MNEQIKAGADARSARADLKAYYDEGYHNAIHSGMIEDENYYKARSEAFSRLYFTPEDRRLAVLHYRCGLGQMVAALPNAYGYDASREDSRHFPQTWC